MSRNPSFPAHLRAQSLAGNNPTTTNLPGHHHTGSLSGSSASPVLLQRIAEKKTELANLQELKNLSDQLAEQMQQLEARLETLSDGTEAIAMVMANWASVLGAIGLASSKMPQPKEEAAEPPEDETTMPMPETLVRIPIQTAESASKAAAAARESAD